jgi:putative ABC transport system substrate-binding protein
MGKGRVLLLTAACAAVAAASAPTRAEGGGSIVALVVPEENPSFAAAAKGFEEELDRRGLATRRVKYRPADIAAAVTSGASLVFAVGTECAVAASAASSEGHGPPVVFAVVGDPIGAGLAHEDGRPRGCSTGVAGLPPAADVAALVGDLAPDARRVGVIANPARTGALVAALERSVAARGLTTTTIAAATAADVGPALEAARASRRPDVLIAVADPSIWAPASVKATAMFALRNRVPLIGFSSAFTRAGAVASLAVEDYGGAGALAAARAAEILAGRPAEEIPVVWPSRARLSLNLVVARRVGVEPPRALVDRAESDGGLFR